MKIYALSLYLYAVTDGFEIGSMIIIKSMHSELKNDINHILRFLRSILNDIFRTSSFEVGFPLRQIFDINEAPSSVSIVFTTLGFFVRIIGRFKFCVGPNLLSMNVPY